MIIPVVTGPTATGKTAAVLRLGESYPVEVISADAFQVYRGMDIGTAKPTPAELSAAPHHLIDIMNPNEAYTAGMFVARAEKLIGEIIDRGNVPVIVGGTGMYVESLVNGIFDGPERDDAYRSRINAIADARGWDFLYERLRRLDPAYAERIKPTDPARITRALEVRRILGIPMSEAHRRFHKAPAYQYRVFVIGRERERLYGMINHRVDVMIEAGWMDEVRRLVDAGYGENDPGFKAIGYRELAAVIRGDSEQSLVIERIKTLTRRFAKRQFTWFRHMDAARWIDADTVDVSGALADFFATNRDKA